MIWLFAPAFAGSVAGLTVPVTGGGFSGPAEHGALGVLFAPTAAVLSEHPDIALDVGYLYNRLEIKLDDWDKSESYLDIDKSPQPTIMASLPIGTPIGRIGFGAGFQVPYLRGGEEPDDGPLRLSLRLQRRF